MEDVLKEIQVIRVFNFLYFFFQNTAKLVLNIFGITPEYPTHHTLLGLGLGLELGLGLGLRLGLGLGLGLGIRVRD